MRSLRDSNRRPTHPGELLREDVLPALEMTQTEFAERLGVSRLTVSELLHGKRALSADMAVRLSRLDRKSTRLNSSHVAISYADFCLKNKTPSHAVEHGLPHLIGELLNHPQPS